MKDKKHIDKLFKERFENFEATPSPKVWKDIQAQLNENKTDHKVIPLWWKLAGVAALLLLLFSVGNYVFNSSETDNSIVNEDKTAPIKVEEEKDQLIKENNINEDRVASEGQELEQEVENEKVSEEKSTSPQSPKTRDTYKKTKATQTGIASEKNSSENKASTQELIDKKKAVHVSEQKETMAVTSGNQKKSTVDSEKTATEKIKSTQEISEKETAITDAKEPKSDNKKSIQDAIDEQKNKDAIVKENNPSNRWEVAPNFAPVYYSSLGNGSSIDPSFTDNSQSGDVNFSYGVQVSYAINDKLSVRSGVNNVNLSYTTGGVELGTGPVAKALKTIDYQGKEVVLTAVDKGTLTQAMPGDAFGNIVPKSTNSPSEIIQDIRYYEVPLELKYALINNKIGVNVIGGFSTLFLGDNAISVKSGSFESTLGEANNLSNVSFTTNIGLGVDYKISKKFTFNLEPMFKYQLNPYTNSSVDFKPYYVGLYSGLRFKF